MIAVSYCSATGSETAALFHSPHKVRISARESATVTVTTVSALVQVAAAKTTFWSGRIAHPTACVRSNEIAIRLCVKSATSSY